MLFGFGKKKNKDNDRDNERVFPNDKITYKQLRKYEKICCIGFPRDVELLKKYCKYYGFDESDFD